MMDRLREGVNSIAVKIILGLIILSFVFAGVGSYIVGGNNNSAAKVGNTEIARGEFEMAYQNERNRMQAQLGDNFSQLLADPAYVESFRKSVLDRMINDVLLDQQAEALGLRISDAQVRSMILDMPQFHLTANLTKTSTKLLCAVLVSLQIHLQSTCVVNWFVSNCLTLYKPVSSLYQVKFSQKVSCSHKLVTFVL